MDVMDMFRFDGKRALVVGGATGMGAEAGRIVQGLGGDVTIMDYADVTLPDAHGVRLDLRDRAAIDTAVDALDGPVHAVLSCAGVGSGTSNLQQVNIIGQRHLIERLLEQDKLPEGSAIAMISSIAGMGWEMNLPMLLEFLATPDYEAAEQWVAEHPKETTPEGTLDYVFSKQAVCAYVASRAFPFLQRGVRINAVMPGIIDTQLAQQHHWLEYDQDWRSAVHTEPTPEKPAFPLVYLCSQAASHVNGVTLTVDAGWTSSQFTGSFVSGALPEGGA
jgi:NAD(P)-dependent dehydrogenase (short-subunit alcohol dehydrogenase family)